ncbi:MULTISPECIES: hypothetical protein [Amycolatopsis]|uniref:Uncharacterized protein n=1 Tax=Amycolatopsis saalfeldensis TaxID=394193 RepID=A0A1H8YPT8_9PSEU|nr:MULTISPECIES: hypothetical protein [Amycolatopsis]SEP54052.1 hypothetical protein SAMN04489732_1369 [Amycolatopsis saalfeldensis]
MYTPSIPAVDGEVYVALDDATQAFPAAIDHQRWNGFAVPRFRRPVAEAVAACINAMHAQDPDEWPDTASFDGEVLTVLEAEGHRPERIEPDENGRYAIGYRRWCWELTVPTPGPRVDAAAQADSARLTPQDDEILVAIDSVEPAFPALPSAGCGWSKAGCPRFRRPVAEAVVAWINDNSDGFDDAYWDGDNVVQIDYQSTCEDGYLPARISADDDGRYSIGASFEWMRRPM